MKDMLFFFLFLCTVYKKSTMFLLFLFGSNTVFLKKHVKNLKKYVFSGWNIV